MPWATHKGLLRHCNIPFFDLLVGKLWRLIRVVRIEKDILGKEAAEDKWDIVPNFGSDGLEPPGTGGVLGRAFSRTVFSKEMLTQVKDMKHCWSAGCCGY